MSDPSGPHALHGADLSDLRRVRGAFDRAAATLAGTASGAARLSASLRDDGWFTGPIAAAHADHLDTVVGPRLGDVAAGLREAATALERHIDEQRLASAADGQPPAVGPGDASPGEPVLPAWVRDRANRHLLRSAVASLHTERSRLQERIAARAGPPHQLAAARRELVRVEATIVTLTRVERDPDLQLLLLDVAAGRIAVAVGDVDTASRVATIVPGTGADLASFAGYLDRADELRFTTQQAAGRADVAVIAWLGYAAPPDLLAAVHPGRAVTAAPDLAAFSDGLAAGNPEARRTVLGHSYGAVVVGETAARFPLDVDAVVGVGAPGMRVRNVDRFQLPDGAEVYAVTDRRGAPWQQDPIGFVDAGILTIGHGPSPAGIGAASFDVADADGHALAAYLDRTTRSGRNIGAVVAGHEPTPRP